jgi:translation initiation factor IF-3
MKKNNIPRSNSKITAATVRLIDHEGNMIGVTELSKALAMAKAQNLDLVEISPTSTPPVCKMLNLGKYKYEAQKKAHDARKKQKIVELKEIKVRPNIGDHDLEIKMNRIKKFIAEGNKVKVSMRFRGREISKNEIAIAVFRRVVEEVKETAKIELHPRMEARQMLMILSPHS